MITRSSPLFLVKSLPEISKARVRWSSTSSLSYPNTPHPSPFEIFSLPHTSQPPDPKELKRRYYALARQYHPDVLGASLSGSSSTKKEKEELEKFAKIKSAYELLSNPDTFQSYIRSGRGWKDPHAPPSRPIFDGPWSSARRGGPMRPSHMRGRYPSGAYDGGDGGARAGFSFDSEGFRASMGERREAWKERSEKGWVLVFMCAAIVALYSAQFFKVGEIHKKVHQTPPSRRQPLSSLSEDDLASPSSPSVGAMPRSPTSISSSSSRQPSLSGAAESAEQTMVSRIFGLAWLKYLSPSEMHREALQKRHNEASKNLAEARERARGWEGNQYLRPPDLLFPRRNEIVLLHRMRKIGDGKEETGH
ncbi:hypothetical protein BT69DRAFT_1297336 [Atractiella rhizophila]|nr:hypothetical protein BT69DRAFT_1297336 [Atractiella rhizophila]